MNTGYQDGPRDEQDSWAVDSAERWGWEKESDERAKCDVVMLGNSMGISDFRYRTSGILGRGFLGKKKRNVNCDVQTRSLRISEFSLVRKRRFEIWRGVCRNRAL